MSQVLRSLGLLVTAGASAASFFQQTRASWLTPFVTANTMSLPNRHRLMVGMAAGAVLALVAGALFAWQAGAGRLRRVARAMSPMILLGFLPPLIDTSAWPNTLNIAMVLGAYTLLAERIYRLAFAGLAEPLAATAPPPGRFGRAVGGAARDLMRLGALIPPRARRWGPTVLVVAAAAGYAIYMSVFTLRMHGRFQTYGYDLGQYDSIFYNTLHGRWMRDTPLGFDKNWEQLRGHAELSVFFLLPLYALRPAASTLLVIQSCVLGLGAIPLYRFARRRLPSAMAVALAVAYLLYPPMHGLQFYDFHFQPIAVTFVLLVIDLVDDRRYWLCGLVFIIALGCREDISVGLAMLGTFLALTGYRVRAGILMAVAASAYFVVMRFIIMPSFGTWFFQGIYKDLFPPGSPTFGGVIATLLSNPVYSVTTVLQGEKLRYALQVLVPVAFLPLRRSWLVWSVVPGSIFTILTTEYAPTIDTAFQYSGHFIPYLFSASALAIAAYRRDSCGPSRQRAALAALWTGTILCGVFWGAIPPRDSVRGGFNLMSMRAPTDAEKRKDWDLRELAAMVPPTATLAMSEAEMPHVSRLWMRSLRDTTDADYILYGLGTGGAGSTNADRVLASGEFQKIAERPGIALLKRRTGAPPPPPAAPKAVTPPPRMPDHAPAGPPSAPVPGRRGPVPSVPPVSPLKR